MNLMIKHTIMTTVAFLLYISFSALANAHTLAEVDHIAPVIQQITLL